VFQQSEAGAVTLNEDYVTIYPGTGKYIELTTGLPQYLKNTGDQSWIIQFRILSSSRGIRLALTTSPSSTASTSDFTGVRINIQSDIVSVIYKKEWVILL